jgi:hypothetical protein
MPAEEPTGRMHTLNIDVSHEDPVDWRECILDVDHGSPYWA